MLSTIRVLAYNGPVLVELARWQGRLVVTKRVVGVSDMLKARLSREAEVVGRLSHPNIVPLLGVVDQTLIYAYSPGLSLAELLDEKKLAASRIRLIMGHVLSALEFAHGRGVIHLDVKPGNILVRGPQTMLTDFGFAKDLALAAITSEHTMLGTPGYMAPEQFHGVRSDPRSDLYAAGAVLWHMLAGAPPYGRDALRFLVGDSKVSLGRLPSEHRHLQPVLERALQHDPGERHQSASEFRQELDRTWHAELA